MRHIAGDSVRGVRAACASAVHARARRAMRLRHGDHRRGHGGGTGTWYVTLQLFSLAFVIDDRYYVAFC